MELKNIAFGLACFFFAVLISNCSGQDQYYFPPEPQCSGFCITKSQCPDGKLSPTESCPKSRSYGAACCYSVPKSEYRCQKFGGECRSTCPEFLTKKEATDCSANQYCCILI